jgi:hypothetical protein
MKHWLLAFGLLLTVLTLAGCSSTRDDTKQSMETNARYWGENGMVMHARQ